jgi:hypothetical protein
MSSSLLVATISRSIRSLSRSWPKADRCFASTTFGDEDFWGGELKLHQAIAGANFGGVGPGLSPRTALALGLKIDQQALPSALIAALKNGQVNLDDPGVTLTLLRLNAVANSRPTRRVLPSPANEVTAVASANVSA